MNKVSNIRCTIIVIVAVFVVLAITITTQTSLVYAATDDGNTFNGKVRINCGSLKDYVDMNGHVWQSDRFYTGGRSYSPAYIPVNVTTTPTKTTTTTTTTTSVTSYLQSLTVQPPPTSSSTTCKRRKNNQKNVIDSVQVSQLYNSCRTGTNFSYSIPVFTNRRVLYRVSLHFYELMYVSSSKRFFVVFYVVFTSLVDTN
jgi:Malectin domain